MLESPADEGVDEAVGAEVDDGGSNLSFILEIALRISVDTFARVDE